MPPPRKMGAGQHLLGQRFPSEKGLIDELVLRSESFRDLCEDLADAEEALVRTASLPRETGAARRAEYEALIEGLLAEIEAIMGQAKVVVISQAPRGTNLS